MPPKSATCSICGETVLKSQTLAIKDGTRACRSHSGVKEESASLQEAEKTRRAKAEQERKERWKPNFNQPFPEQKELREWRQHLDTHCWVCDREGVGLQEFYMQALIAITRLQIRKEFNLLSLSNDVRKLMPGYLALVAIPYDDETDAAMKHRIRDKKIRDLLHFIRYMQLCSDCVTKYGYQEQFEETCPKPSIEQVEAIMPIMSSIDPILRRIADRKEGQS
jgi:hypothetical protein